MEATTRVNAQWVNPDRFATPKLTFSWADEAATTFSFDLGGILLGGELTGQEFLAEIKFYGGPADQGNHYMSYLAKCYRALAARPDRCDNFMWVTWSPFSIKRWKDLCSASEVEAAVLKHGSCALGAEDEDAARRLLDRDCCAAVSEKLWLIVLSERQEKLVVSTEHRAVIRADDVRKGGAS